MEVIYQTYRGQPVEVIAAGDDWGQPYTCESWARSFGLTFPILNDDFGYFYSLFGTGYIPHNIIIDETGVVLYSQPGFNQGAIVYTINEALNSLGTDDEFVLSDTPQLFVWPNPSNDYMIISGNGAVSIYNIQGRLIKELYLTDRYQWDTRKLPSGIYYLINNEETIKVTLLK